MEKKYLTTSDYNKFTSNTLDAKITQNKLVNESDLDRKIKEDVKTLATKEQLLTKQDKIVKLQTYDLSIFIGQSYFNNDGSQNYLILQPIFRTITIFSGPTSTISEWESKGLSNKNFKPLYTANKSLLSKTGKNK